ncbi:TetR family transcriptional regulator [Chitinasiproducens palmae]|uniref:Transcriptional regulator, TetR family n=1 Tax=Chitinasiproducens palmae TaxID=1770053 RepID=A0A1H2PW94_9BURK|nr:TetR family transcriptional regulator [Chitinasiproducens palmae]SDV51615.1 transcriptional regulator, TetR family [Chitinasiproducens palmae]
MARRTKEDALETRGLILDTAERVFYDKGVSRTSLADIAEAAGVSRGAIYWHFKNKCELFNAMFDRVVLPMDELMGEAPTAHDPLGQMRRAMIDCLCSIAEDPRRTRIFSVLFHKCELTHEMGPLFERHRAHQTRAREQIEAKLRRAIEAGQLPAELNTAHAAAMLHAQLGGLVNDWLFSPESLDLASSAACYIDAFVEMMKVSRALRLTPPVAHRERVEAAHTEEALARP